MCVRGGGGTDVQPSTTQTAAGSDTAAFANGSKLVDLVRGEEEVGEKRRGVSEREGEKGAGVALLGSRRSAACEEGYGSDGYVPQQAHAGRT